MTFIVGFHCFNGLVLCADSEENDGINKKYVDKLYGIKIPETWELCFGGSGSAIAIDKFHSKLFPLLTDNPSDQIKTELTIETSLKFMGKSYPQYVFDILVGQCDLKSGNTFLYRTYEAAPVLRPIPYGEFTCIGMDTSLAHFFLASIFDAVMGVEEALRLGLWVTSMSKVHSSGVGGPSMAFSYKKGDSEGWRRHFTHQIAGIEAKYSTATVQAMLRAYWIEKNSDIYKIVDGQPIRGEPNK
jgi:hypothetical protein